MPVVASRQRRAILTHGRTGRAKARRTCEAWQTVCTASDHRPNRAHRRTGGRAHRKCVTFFISTVSFLIFSCKRVFSLKNSTPKPPKILSAEAKKLWRDLSADYGIIDSAGLRLLQTACESLDSMRNAQAIVTAHGAVIPDRFGQLRANPATVVERDARSAMMQALKALHLDPTPQVKK